MIKAIIAGQPKDLNQNSKVIDHYPYNLAGNHSAVFLIPKRQVKVMKIEGYAKEIADFLSLFAEYSAGQKKAPHLNFDSKLKEMFPTDKHYPPNYDEGYPPTFAD